MVISDKTKGQVKSFVIFPFGRFFIYKMEILQKHILMELFDKQ